MSIGLKYSDLNFKSLSEPNENSTESAINTIDVTVIDSNDTVVESNDTLIDTTSEVPLITTASVVQPVPTTAVSSSPSLSSESSLAPNVTESMPPVVAPVSESVPSLPVPPATELNLNRDRPRDRDRLRKVRVEVLQTNMLDNEVERCVSAINLTVGHEYGSRKTARLIKTNLDDIFKDQKYRFSVVISDNETHIISKRLYGIWISLTANRKHYLLMGSFKAVAASKPTEAQMDRIEDWTAVYFVTYENMTHQALFDKVTRMTKEKLDLNYGKGNAWAVIAYRNPTTIKAKRFLDGSPHLQFKRLDGSYWLVFRGGEDIALTNRANRVRPK